MSSYSNFAPIYDSLMDDVDYCDLTEYLLHVFKIHDHFPKLLLDAACGTGKFSVEFDKKGIEVIGVDVSADMLDIARERLTDTGVLLLNQDLCELDLYGTVDSTVCNFDSLNHITDKRTFQKIFDKISLFTEPGGLFIFDVNTEYKHKYILSNNVFIYDEEDFYLVWQNELEGDKTFITLDIFKEKDGFYQRFSEDFCERYYSHEFIVRALKKAGFLLENHYGYKTLKKPTKKCERILYVARKENTI